VVVGVNGAGEESAAVVFGSVSALPHRCRAREAVQLLSCASIAVSHVRVLTVTSPEQKLHEPRSVSRVRVHSTLAPNQ
jgi:hypothetical protein